MNCHHLYDCKDLAVDFKGWFKTGDGKRCDPLTMSDLYSRYVLATEALRSQTMEESRPVFEKVFSGYALPEAIRPKPVAKILKFGRDYGKARCCASGC